MFQLSQVSEIAALRALTADGRLLFATRMVRMFAYGFLSLVLVLYLQELGLNEVTIGGILTATLLGDVAISLWLTNIADRIGRRRMLLVGAGLMIFAGVVFALTDNLIVLVITAIIGTISPSGNEVGPFLPIEQAALTQNISDQRRTPTFALYGLFGSLATAFGSLLSGVLAAALQNGGMTHLASYRIVVLGYGLLGIALAIMFTRLSEAVELPPGVKEASPLKTRFGLHRSQGIIFRLTLLFVLDAFAGGLVTQSLIAAWFSQKFGIGDAVLGGIFFGTNFLAGLSALAAARIAGRIGLINTMFLTHVPSNILLILVPLMPSANLAILCLWARFSISQMDVPTRQSYTMAVVAPDERSAAAGITNVARTAATAMAFPVTGVFFSLALLSVPFLLSGGLKLVYDFALLRSFSAIKPPEEQTKIA